jgi:hypothetical protein
MCKVVMCETSNDVEVILPSQFKGSSIVITKDGDVSFKQIEEQDASPDEIEEFSCVEGGIIVF